MQVKILIVATITLTYKTIMHYKEQKSSQMLYKVFVFLHILTSFRVALRSRDNRVFRLRIDLSRPQRHLYFGAGVDLIVFAAKDLDVSVNIYIKKRPACQ